MTRQLLQPELNKTYFQKRGIQAWDIAFNNKPELKEAALKSYRACGLYEIVDFYAVSKTTVMLQIKLTQAGVEYYGRKTEMGKMLADNYFHSHWSLEPAL